MTIKINHISIVAARQMALGGSLCANSVLPGAPCLYIPSDALILCSGTKKDNVVLGYERSYAIYRSLSGRKKFNGSTEMFRPTVGFCIQGDLGTTR
jgi:hypothetical protein